MLARLLTRVVRPLLWRAPSEVTSTVERLRAAVDGGAVLHGTREPNLNRLEARRQTDYFGRPAEGVFATRDPIWPIFYAIVDRESAGSLRCQCLPGKSGTRYSFSTEGDPRWAPGFVYVLPGDGFVPIAGTSEMVCHAKPQVQVAEVVDVDPADFPFLTNVGRHPRSEPIWKTFWRLRSNQDTKP